MFDNRRKMAESELTRRHYWDDFYSSEYQHFKDSGCEGEEWFESETESILDFIMTLVDPLTASVIDVGCGNGLFLLRLASLGFTQLAGCDYAEDAIRMAREVCWSRCHANAGNSEASDGLSKGLTIRLAVMDITADPGTTSSRSTLQETSAAHPLSPHISIVPSRELCETRFDLIHDKGTFDIFYMQNNVSAYINALSRYFVKPGSLICVTSCNATEDDLIRNFTNPPGDTPMRYRFREHSKLRHRAISYGGLQGQVVATVVFRAEGAPVLS